MIRYVSGNLLDSDAEALVNTVNEIGVMGKGVALMFRDAFPENTRRYTTACKSNQVNVGKMFVVQDKNRFIINFPTKKHWRNPSKIEWIRDGLQDLVSVILEKQIKSIAIPKLGCGAGGLEWVDVKKEIENALGKLEKVDITILL